MQKQRPGIQRACAYLNGLTRSDGRLPPVRALAQSAGVSFVTMWKALKYLQEKGIIVADSRGNRTFAADGTCPLPPLRVMPSTETKRVIGHAGTASYQHVAEKLYKAIITGHFTGSDHLPSCKELQRLYGVSFATLKKSLGILVEQQILEPRANGYFFPSLTGGTGHARIVAIGCGWEDGKIWVDYQDKNYFRALESECIRMNIQLDVIVYYRKEGRLRFIDTASKKEYALGDRAILGYVFIVANLDSTPEEVLERLTGLGRDIAVLDVVGGWKVPRCARNNNFIQLFTATASELPAKRVSQYLLGKGHRHIAFFSPFHRALWSQQRFSAITGMFSAAGNATGVMPFVVSKYAYQWDYLKSQEHQNDLRTLVKQYNEWKLEANSAFLQQFGNLGYSIFNYITEGNCASGLIYNKMKPLFEEALDKKNITAWVMANDFTATIALDYLKDRGIRIPEDIAIVSFDNTLDAMEHHLTSYDFNNHGIISVMLRYILAPNTIKNRRKGGCIEVEGTLVVRRSG